MRIYGPGAANLGASAQGTRRAGGSNFSVPDPVSTGDTRAASAPRPAGGIESLLALQSVDDTGERRRRSVQRGRGALDALEELKISLLSGALDPNSVDRLRAVAADLKETSGNPGLDAVLSDIELRVEVELAKASRLRA